MKQERHSLRSTKVESTTITAANISNTTDHFSSFDPSYTRIMMYTTVYFLPLKKASWT